MADSISAKILRFDPSVDDAPAYVTYEVPWQDDPSGFMTGLQVLHYINNSLEQIGYDYCCRSGLCGRCSMLIDGKPGLACWTALQPGEHTFEPLKGFPVLKDLVVDRSATYDKFVATNAAIQTLEPIVTLKNIDHDLWWNTLERLNMCRECLCCYAACPKLQDEGKWSTFIGPGAMMQIGLRYLDTQDEADRVQQAVLSGVFECDLCGECAKVCPSHIDFTGVIDALQKDAVARNLKPAAVTAPNWPL